MEKLVLGAIEKCEAAFLTKMKAPGDPLLEDQEVTIYNPSSGLFCHFSSSSLQESQGSFKIVSMLN